MIPLMQRVRELFLDYTLEEIIRAVVKTARILPAEGVNKVQTRNMVCGLLNVAHTMCDAQAWQHKLGREQAKSRPTMWFVFVPHTERTDGVEFSAMLATKALAEEFCEKYGADFNKCAKEYIVIESEDQLW